MSKALEEIEKSIEAVEAKLAIEREKFDRADANDPVTIVDTHNRIADLERTKKRYENLRKLIKE